MSTPETKIPYRKLIDDVQKSPTVSFLPVHIETHQDENFDASRMYNNRNYAIVCMNLFTILQFLFMMGSKYVMGKNNVNGLDYTLMRTIGVLSVHTVSL